MCRKTSLPPELGLIKPKPLSAFQFLIVPFLLTAIAHPWLALFIKNDVKQRAWRGHAPPMLNRLS
jgi:hypothetical protein